MSKPSDIQRSTAAAILEMRRRRTYEEIEAWRLDPRLAIQVKRAEVRMNRYDAAEMRRQVENPTLEEIAERKRYMEDNKHLFRDE